MYPAKHHMPIQVAHFGYLIDESEAPYHTEGVAEPPVSLVCRISDNPLLYTSESIDLV